jgi:hypothetical protein
VSHALAGIVQFNPLYAAYDPIPGGLKPDTKVYSIIVKNKTLYEFKVDVRSKTTSGTLGNGKMGVVGPQGEFLLYTSEKDYKFQLDFRQARLGILFNSYVSASDGKETTRNDGFKAPDEPDSYYKDVELSRKFEIIEIGKQRFNVDRDYPAR